jgi:hypothetical protein
MSNIGPTANSAARVTLGCLSASPMCRTAILVLGHSKSVPLILVKLFAAGAEMETSNSATFCAKIHIENHSYDDEFAGLHDQKICNRLRPKAIAALAPSDALLPPSER